MKKKYKVVLIVIVILLVGVIRLGSSYAMWVYNISQENINFINGDCFEISFVDKNEINLSNTFPITEEEASELVPYTFKIKNVCNHRSNYMINIESLSGSTLDVNNIRYKLDDYDSKILGSLDDNTSFVSKNAIRSNTILRGYLDSNFEKEFNLKIWLDEGTTIEQASGKTFLSKIVVVAEVKSSAATLIAGYSFNQKINNLACVEDDCSLDYINNIVLTDVLDSDTEIIENVSTSDDIPIYAWFENGIIYLYSSSIKIYLNLDSSYMFSNMKHIEYLDLSFLDSSNVEEMSNMFWNMENLKWLDISSFDTSKVANMECLFLRDGLLETVYVSDKWSTKKLINGDDIFYGCESIIGIDGTTYDSNYVDKEYARVDDANNGNPGYLTLKEN